MDKVFSFIEKHAMIQAGDRIVLGVSGGADSVCLLFLLKEYAKRAPIELVAVHVNHGIRPDAGKDAAYVEKLCEREGIPFFLAEENVRELADREKCSEEDAGRRLRYRVFREIMEREGAAKIAVAHNAEDRAETMLLHLFRGSGLRGLCGMEPVRGEIIRPLLCLSRKEIEAYLCERGISWCTDSTNAGDDYARNRIRHHILPYAEEAISAKVTEHMCRTADLLSETEEFLRQQASEARRSCTAEGYEGEGCTVEGGAGDGCAGDRAIAIDVEAFLKIPKVLQKRILLEMAEELSPTGKDISFVHVEDVRKLFEGAGNRSVDLPFGICFRREYGRVYAERGRACGEGAEGGKRGKAGGKGAEGGDLPGGGSAREELPLAEYEILPREENMKIPENQYTKWFDYDKIKDSPTLRFRQEGDYLTISDGKGGMCHKSLKDYMITEKIPKAFRGRIPVIAEGSHVLWLVGYRISEYYKITGDTERILQIKIIWEK